VCTVGRSFVGEFERCVLLGTHRLQGQGYAVSITDEIERRLGKAVSLGAVYATLDRLERKGFVSSKLGDPTPERGGRPKRFYQLSAPGLRALDEARDMNIRIWREPAASGMLP
jgi:PadR family transcriptional regulator